MKEKRPLTALLLFLVDKHVDTFISILNFDIYYTKVLW